VLGVFGGAFDPPHLGHAMVPAYLRLRGLAERVLVVPCADHPLGKDLSPLPRRMALVRAAMASHGDAVEVSDVEARLLAAHGGPSYTLRMLEAVAAEHPGYAVRLVVGSDIVGEVQRWHRWDEIERRFSPIVVPRTGHAPADACALPAVSSTQVRAWLAALREDPGAEGGGEEAAARALAEDGLASAVPAAVLRLLRRPEGAPVWVVGSGNVAAHAVPWLEDRGQVVVRLGARALVEGAMAWPEAAPAGVWLLARDPALPELARALVQRELPVEVPVLHGAGALRADEALAPLWRRGHPVGTLHPICSLRAERPWPSPLPRAAFGVEGDPPARALALSWIEAQPWLDLQRLSAEARRAYHAACSLAANHLAVPYAAAVEVLAGQGHAEATVKAATGELMRSALDNLVGLGLPDGVTGPVARGDEAAVRAHLEALPPEAASLYRMLSERLATLVARARA
jgi:nicotinate-nucleotide adenylyltransferase